MHAGNAESRKYARPLIWLLFQNIGQDVLLNIKAKMQLILTDFTCVLSVKGHSGYPTNPMKMDTAKHSAYMRNNLQGEEKSDNTTIKEMKSAIIEILKHHGEPIGWGCIISNLQGTENAYEALCELLNEGKVKREWTYGKRGSIRKVFRLE